MRINESGIRSKGDKPAEIPPKVSIGMPLYHGERYLREALDSIRSQDFADYEVIISDNASTDSTGEICRQFAAENPRVRFYSQEKNIGAADNFNFVFEKARAPYFIWFSHDDGWDPTYLRKCVAILDRHPSVVLCFSDVEFMDAEGFRHTHEEFYGCGFNRMDTFRQPLLERIRILIAELNWYAIYGMYRSEALRKTRKATKNFGWDVYQLLEIILLGESFILPEKLMHYRIIPKTAQQQLRDTISPDAAVIETHYTGLAQGLFYFLMGYDFGRDLRSEIRKIFIRSILIESSHWRNVLVRENWSRVKDLSPDEGTSFLIGLFPMSQQADSKPASVVGFPESTP